MKEEKKRKLPLLFPHGILLSFKWKDECKSSV